MAKPSLPLYKTIGPSYLAILCNSGWPDNTNTLHNFGYDYFHSYYHMSVMDYYPEYLIEEEE